MAKKKKEETTKETTATAEPAKKLSKIAMVCEAQDAQGAEATPKTIQEFIKEKHSIEVSVNHISNIRSQLKKKSSGEAPKKRGPKSKHLETNGHTVIRGIMPFPPHGGEVHTDTPEGSVSLSDVASVKELVQRYGADVLRQLVDVVGR